MSSPALDKSLDSLLPDQLVQLHDGKVPLTNQQEEPPRLIHHNPRDLKFFTDPSLNCPEVVLRTLILLGIPQTGMTNPTHNTTPMRSRGERNGRRGEKEGIL